MIASCIIALKGHSRKDLYPSEEISAIQGGGGGVLTCPKGKGGMYKFVQGVTLCKKPLYLSSKMFVNLNQE